MSEIDGSRVRGNIQFTESNEVSGMSPTATEAQSELKRKMPFKSTSKPSKPRKVVALR